MAMAYGRECCLSGMKTYFLKTTELNQKLIDAVKYGREGSAINSLVKPTCLIIDEIGRCVFNKESTRMFFDVIDRRYNKESPKISKICQICQETYNLDDNGDGSRPLSSLVKYA